MPQLPETYKLNMQKLLGEHFPEYEASFGDKRVFGLRRNRLKISQEAFETLLPFSVKRIPWIDNGYYYEEDVRPAKNPLYYAGLYYLQEPSAMTPANRLPIDPGDKVLDLCAAPGGKSTELGAKLAHEGLLVTNDISNSRAQALLKNIELFGIDNACVLSEAPYKMVSIFPEFFDKVLIDAPCSGEGMFRKDTAVMKAWTPNSNAEYSKLQREILEQAIAMLKPGGLLMYSTCTFSPMENEASVEFVLSHFPQMHTVAIEGYEGFCSAYPGAYDASEEAEYKNCVRIWPQHMRGEGHFLTMFRKDAQEASGISHAASAMYDSSKELAKHPEFKAFTDLLKGRFRDKRFFLRQDKVYCVPDELCDISGLRILRPGLFVGECKKMRFEPSQALAMTLEQDEFENTISFSLEDERVIRYLKGETIDLSSDESILDGLCLICVEGHPLGFGKAKNKSIKNKYLSGWRWQ